MRKLDSKSRFIKLLIPIFVGFGLYSFFQVREKGRASEAKGYLMGIYTAQKSYKDEWGKYPTSLSEVGFSINGKDSFVFNDATALPEEVKKQLTSDWLPFVKDDSYQILLVLNRHSKQTIWSVNDKNEISQFKAGE